MSFVSQQEVRQVRQALKEEISRHTQLVAQNEANILDHADNGTASPQQVMMWKTDIESSKRAIAAAAACLGIHPSEKRGPGRPPKNPLAA